VFLPSPATFGLADTGAGWATGTNGCRVIGRRRVLEGTGSFINGFAREMAGVYGLATGSAANVERLARLRPGSDCSDVAQRPVAAGIEPVLDEMVGNRLPGRQQRHSARHL
jgi:hypothetical protein